MNKTTRQITEFTNKNKSENVLEFTILDLKTSLENGIRIQKLQLSLCKILVHFHNNFAEELPQQCQYNTSSKLIVSTDPENSSDLF